MGLLLPHLAACVCACVCVVIVWIACNGTIVTITQAVVVEENNYCGDDSNSCGISTKKGAWD